MAKVNCYLAFDGTCEAAFSLYKSVFGGEFNYIGRYQDMPASEAPLPDSAKNLIMHVGLPISKETTLMGCDVCPAMSGTPHVVGNNVSICISAQTEEEAHRIFNALSEGGTVTMPLEKTFWSPLFGMLTDKFGVNWLLDVDMEQA